MNSTTNKTLKQQPSTGLPWTGLSLILAVSWMLSLAFSTQRELEGNTPDIASSVRLHPAVQIGLLSGLHLASLSSSSVATLNSSNRIVKVTNNDR